MSETGFNPLRWNCERQGCFNKKKRPKIEVFHDLFPGKISMSDVDGIVEINGHVMLMEWKAPDAPYCCGQSIMYQRMSEYFDVVVFMVRGDAETMTVERFGVFWMGEPYPCGTPSMPSLRAWIARWVDYSLKTPVRKSQKGTSSSSLFS